MLYNIIEEEVPKTQEVSLNEILKNPQILDRLAKDMIQVRLRDVTKFV
jgi:hypothetical protein